MRFSTTKAEAQEGGIKGVIYGASGVGKTRLSATLDSVIILSAERGLLSLADSNIPVIHLDNENDVIEAYKFLLNDPKGAVFQNIVLDSISDIAEMVSRSFSVKFKDLRKAIGEANNFTTQVIRNFRDIHGRNVFFIAKEKAVNGVFEPAMPSSGLSANLPYFFDLVARMRIIEGLDGKSSRSIQCQASFDTVAKDRSGKLDLMEQPDLTAIINKLTGK